MRNWWTTAAIGAGAGLIASFAMAQYQAAAAKPFGMDKSDDDPATVKAADDASLVTTGARIPEPERKAAGSAVHYATGTGLGVLYALAARRWPLVTAGFGTAYGAVTTALLDNLLVPALGWGKWPTQAGAASELYGVSAHGVYGMVLEGARRGAMRLAAAKPG